MHREQRLTKIVIELNHLFIHIFIIVIITWSLEMTVVYLEGVDVWCLFMFHVGWLMGIELCDFRTDLGLGLRLSGWSSAGDVTAGVATGGLCFEGKESVLIC